LIGLPLDYSWTVPGTPWANPQLLMGPRPALGCPRPPLDLP
jgi:hypothetical protein